MRTHGELAWLDVRWPLFAVRPAPYVAIRMKRMFPKIKQARKGWLTLSDTPEVARDLEWLLQRYPMVIDEAAAARLAARAAEHRATESTVASILSGERPHLAFQETARPAREYQLVAADLALATGRLLLADVLGLGKTMSALLVLREPEALPALVVCPTHLPAQWQGELEKTLPNLRSHVVRKGTPYDVTVHQHAKGPDPDVLIVPYSKLRGWGDYLAGKVRTVIFDEAQELRRRDSQKWTAAARVAEEARYRLGLTATPVYNYAGEIHSIYEVLSPDALGSRDEFVREWGGGQARSSIGDNVSVADPGALGEYLRAEGLMLRRTRSEVGRELPEVVRVVHSIDADEEVLDELTAEALDLAEMLVSREAAREELWRAGGEFDWRMRRATGLAKAPYVAEFVKLLLESERQAVLFGWHRDVYAIWQRRLAKAKPVFYTGTESPAAKNRSRDAFVDGEARVLVMSLRSGAGLDGLQEVAHVAVFGELDWSPGMHEQCIGRLHRDGQGEGVVAYFLVSDHGADPVMAEVLNLKRMQSEPLLDRDAPTLAPAADTSDRIRRLAQDVLERRRA